MAGPKQNPPNGCVTDCAVVDARGGRQIAPEPVGLHVEPLLLARQPAAEVRVAPGAGAEVLADDEAGVRARHLAGALVYLAARALQ